MFACIHHISLQLYVAQVRTVLRLVHFPMNRLTKDKDWLDAHLLVHFLCNTLSHASNIHASIILNLEVGGKRTKPVKNISYKGPVHCMLLNQDCTLHSSESTHLGPGTAAAFVSDHVLCCGQH